MYSVYRARGEPGRHNLPLMRTRKPTAPLPDVLFPSLFPLFGQRSTVVTPALKDALPYLSGPHLPDASVPCTCHGSRLAVRTARALGPHPGSGATGIRGRRM